MSVIDGITYPFENMKSFAIMGLVSVITGLCIIYNPSFGVVGIDPIGIAMMVAWVLGIFLISGVLLNTVRNTINGIAEHPEITSNKNFVEGLKLTAINIFYTVIIGVITVLAGYSLKVVELYQKAAPYYMNNSTINPLGLEKVVAFNASATLLIGIFVLLTFIVGIPWLISVCRMAKFDSIKEGLNFNQIFSDIKRIGWGNYLKNYIVLILYLIIIIFIGLFVMGSLGFIGAIITLFVVFNYMYLYTGRAFGLIYLYGEDIEYNSENTIDQ
ncbi:MAG: DUF4013 domain-containing protein [Methanobrevibacter sp.]|jgi:hypothetical protein|nr:DUF4013 domain-containing protein [Methanobrevibacter sp.]